MQKLGRHLIVEFYGCNKVILNNVEKIKQHMLIAAEKTGATIVGDMFHQFTPQGASGAVILAESHLSIHTWPEYQYAAMDFFTCGDTCDPYKGFLYLKEIFGASSESIKELERGLQDGMQFDTPVCFKPSIQSSQEPKTTEQ